MAKQGKCKSCQVIWTWYDEKDIPMADCRCHQCGRPLTRTCGANEKKCQFVPVPKRWSSIECPVCKNPGRFYGFSSDRKSVIYTHRIPGASLPMDNICRVKFEEVK